MVAGTTAVTATAVLSAVAQVGMIMSVVGTVTKSKELSKIGGIMSIVGGIGGLAAGALSGAAGAASGAAGASGALEAAGSIGSLGSDALSAGAGGLDAATAGMDLSSTLGDTFTAAAPTPIIQSAPPVAPMTSAAPTASSFSEATGATPTMGAALDPSSTTPLSTAGQGAAEVMTPNDRMLAAGTKATPMEGGGIGPPQSSQSFFGKVGSFFESNPKLASAGLQLVGGAMNGANQNAAFNEKMAFEKERANRANSVANMTPTRPTGIVAGASA